MSCHTPCASLCTEFNVNVTASRDREARAEGQAEGQSCLDGKLKKEQNTHCRKEQQQQQQQLSESLGCFDKQTN